MENRTGTVRKPTVVPYSNSNLAYDLQDFENRNLKRAKRPEPQTTPAPKAAARRRTWAMPRVSAFMVASFVTFLGITLMIVYSYMQINELTTEGSRLKSQLSTLQTEEAKLNTAMEQRISLKELEEQALAMGMIKPEGESVSWFDLSGEDHAEVVKQQKGLLASIGDTISGWFSGGQE